MKNIKELNIVDIQELLDNSTRRETKNFDLVKFKMETYLNTWFIHQFKIIGQRRDTGIWETMLVVIGLGPKGTYILKWHDNIVKAKYKEDALYAYDNYKFGRDFEDKL